MAIIKEQCSLWMQGLLWAPEKDLRASGKTIVVIVPSEPNGLGGVCRRHPLSLENEKGSWFFRVFFSGAKSNIAGLILARI